MYLENSQIHENEYFQCLKSKMLRYTNTNTNTNNLFPLLPI